MTIPTVTIAVEDGKQTERDFSLTVSIANNGLSFNGAIEVSGTIIGINGEEIHLAFLLFQNGLPLDQNNQTTISMDGPWQYSIDVTDYEPGEYSMVVKFENYHSEPTFFTIRENVVELESDDLLTNVDQANPIVTITSDYYLNEAIITGTSSEEIQHGELLLDMIGGDEQFEPITFNAEEGEKSFAIPLTITEGEYRFDLVVADLSGNTAETSGQFIVDKTRPYILPESLFPEPNMVQVPLFPDDSPLAVSFEISDNHEILEGSIPTDAIETFDVEGKKVQGSISFNSGRITFTASEEWQYNSKYFVVVNPLIQDQAGNLIHPRNWSFTTETNTEVESPHGGYLANTNTCKTCHNVHTAPRPLLEGPELELLHGSESEIAKISNKKLPDAVNGYCMACHDGTVASPMDDHIGQKSDHNKELIRKDGSVVSQSCGSCHNVHLESHEDNTNLLKDRFFHNHNDPEVGFVDSSEQLCETCHDTDPFAKIDSDVSVPVTYEVFRYRGWNTILPDGGSFGSSEDYQLCLRCHNEGYSQQYEGVVDIESSYQNPESGHIIRKPEGSDYLADGSYLDGHMPCADCHETHSSSNVKLLKKLFGHNEQTEYVQIDDWMNESERAFCMNCHNNKTELYGRVVSFREVNKEGKLVPEHLPGSTESCANCHGGLSGTFREAAHSPAKK